MPRLKTIAFTMLALLTTVIGGSLFSLRPAEAQGNSESRGSAPVTIVGPLPLPVSGTT